MTREEFKKIVWETKVSGLTANHGDPLRDLLSEIYFEGYREGYIHAVELLGSFGPGLAGCDMDKFFDNNMGKIHRRVEAINELQRDMLRKQEENSYCDSSDRTGILSADQRSAVDEGREQQVSVEE